MSKFAAQAGGQTGMIVAGAVVVAVVVGGGAYLMRNRDDPAPQTAPVTAPQTAPVTATATAPEARPPQPASEPAPSNVPEPAASDTPAPAPQQEAVATTVAPEAAAKAPAPQPPSFDEVRTESDGLTVIAGKAAPGSQVILLVDGAEAARVTAEANGTFAAIAMLDPSPKARLLTLFQTDGDTSLASADQIILAPVAKALPAPQTQAVAVAETAEPPATPAPEPAPAAEPKPAPQTSAAQPEVTESQAPEPEVTEPQAPDTQITETQKPEPQAPELVADPAPEPVTAEQAVQTPAPEPTETTQTAAVEPAKPAAPEPTEVAVLKAGADGVEVISRSSAPEVMSNVAIDTISYSDTGDVRLSGRAQADARLVRVYLDNAPVITLNVDTSGRWRGSLPDVDTGVYTLRVDEVSGGGVVTSRVETPFKREDPQVLAEAQTDATQPISAITVQTGATLWAIARDRYGDGLLYVRVVEANKDAIKDPDLIYPGQIFELPDDQ